MADTAVRQELTVSEVTRRVKQLVEGAPELDAVWIRGEVSNVRLISSGHLYFTLKDEGAQLRGAYFRYGARRKPPADGELLLVHGGIRVYEARGEYQLVADDLIKAGIGDLAAKFEALKRRLDEAGLFRDERKTAPPAVPRRIGIVTGLATAALQDVLNVLRRRAPYLGVVLFPASVQGEGAPPELIAALLAADACPGLEVILLVRGGGSLEDLWCFNDEGLARVLAEIRRPVITGIGHEIDFTIADFVADRRAPTPSAAAELVAPDAAELAAGVADRRSRLVHGVDTRLRQTGEALNRLFDRRVVRDVTGALDGAGQDLDSLADRLAGAAAAGVRLDGQRGLDGLLTRLALPVGRRLDDAAHLLPRRLADLLRSGRTALEQKTLALNARERELGSGDPRSPKKLGFALVWDTAGGLVRDAAAVKPGDPLRIEVRDGEFTARRE